MNHLDHFYILDFRKEFYMRVKDIIITIGFITILLVLLLINIVKQDQEISLTERRKLAKFPKITLKRIVNGEVSKEIEEYTTDQFVARDTFREIKSSFNTRNIKTKR